MSPILARVRTLGLATLVVALCTSASPGEQASDRRLIVVISDLHLGVGHVRVGDLGVDGDLIKLGEWHPYEDFRWSKELDSFLSYVNRVGNGATDLVLNGDTFELWQSAVDDCRYDDPDLGCSEQEAVDRIKR